MNAGVDDGFDDHSGVVDAASSHEDERLGNWRERLVERQTQILGLAAVR